MPHTNFVLGDNWKNVWPDSINVIHEGTYLSRKYVLERTCKNIATNADDFCCSECNAFAKGKMINGFDYWYPIGKALNHCPNCGAKVVN